jgi:hypothetical protein
MKEKTCTKCGETKPIELFRRDRSKQSGRKQPCKCCAVVSSSLWEKKNPERKRKSGENRRLLLRSKVLEAYDRRCACCGESEPKFLSIDHIFNDGAEHRREQKVSAGSRFYAWLARNGFPKDRFQLLCHNCNMAKGLYGECPHTKARQLAA